MKHVIEPRSAWTTSTDRRLREDAGRRATSSDFVVGGAAQLTYGLTNRLFARGQGRRTASAGRRASSSRSACSRPTTPIPTRVATTARTRAPSGTVQPIDLSPVALTARVSPTGTFDAQLSRRIRHLRSGAAVAVGRRRRQCHAGRPSARQLQPQRRSVERQQLPVGVNYPALVGRTGERDVFSQLGHRAVLHREPDRLSRRIWRSAAGSRSNFRSSTTPRRRVSRSPRTAVQLRVRPRRPRDVLELLRRLRRQRMASDAQT